MNIFHSLKVLFELFTFKYIITSLPDTRNLVINNRAWVL